LPTFLTSPWGREPEQASMTRETARQLVKQMAEADALIEAALRVPLPSARRTGSGLVQQQAIFQRASRR